jgi:hypothetical protein
MEVIRPNARSRPTERALAVARLIGALYVVAGLSVAWLTLETPFVDVFAARGRALANEPAFHTLGWVVALCLPALCLLVGTHRILDFVDLPNPFRARRDPLARLGSGLGDAYVAVRGLVLPGGREIATLLVGPPGIVVLGQLPAARDARSVGSHWEARTSDDQWVAIENPLDRAARDAEAVRRWLIAEDHDYVVKVYAAVITGGGSAVRSSTTSVIDQRGIPAFLATLPPHRTFTTARRRQLVERIRQGTGSAGLPAGW